MKEERKQRINKLMIPFTKRTLSFLTATTMLVTGITGCKEDDKTESSDITTSISSNSSEDTVPSDVVDSSIISSSEDILSSEEPSSKEDSSIISSDNSSKPSTNSSTSTSKPSSSTTTTSSSKPSSSSNSSSKPTTSTPSTPSVPTMPSTLTASNINDVEVFKHYANEFNSESFPFTPVFNYGYYYNGQLYRTDGEREFQLIMAMLNKNAVASSTLKELFSGVEQKTLNQYSAFADVLVDITVDKKIVYNFDKYITNKELGKYIKTYQGEYVKLSQGQSNNFKQIAMDYFLNSEGQYYYGNTNAFVDYFLYWLTSYGLNLDFSARLDTKIKEIQKNINNDYESYFLNISNEIYSKTKVLN